MARPNVRDTKYDTKQDTKHTDRSLCTFVQIWLITTNAVFFFCGLVLIISGLCFEFDNDLLRGRLGVLFGSLIVERGGATVATNIVTLSNFFIALGVVVLIISFIGGCGATFQYKILLGVYTLVMTILVLVVIIGVVLALFARNQDPEKMTAILKKQMYSSYKGSHAKDSISISWNFLFFHLECCGIVNYRDFRQNKYWNVTTEYTTPLFCCKGIQDFVGPVPPHGDAEWNCAKNPTTYNSYYQNGCSDTVRKWLDQNIEPIIITGISVLIVIVICCGCAIKMLVTIERKEDYMEIK